MVDRIKLAAKNKAGKAYTDLAVDVIAKMDQTGESFFSPPPPGVGNDRWFAMLKRIKREGRPPQFKRYE